MDSKALYLEKPWLRSYPKDMPAEVEVPKKSISSAFEGVIEKWGSRAAFIFYGRKMSYSELKDQVDRFATALHNLGVRKGDKVGLLLLNSPQFIISYLGALKIGAILSPISPVYVSSEIKYQIEDSGTETIVCQDILYGNVKRASVSLRNIILTNVGEYLPVAKKLLGKSILKAVYKKMELPTPEVLKREGVYQFQDLIKKNPPNPPPVEIQPEEDIAVLPYTGGTTRLPKGVMLTHYNIIASEQNLYLTLREVLKEGQETLLAYQPFYHIMGQVGVIANALLRGYTLVIFTTPDYDEILSAIEKYNVSAFLGAPAIYEYLKSYDKTDRVNWKRLKIIQSGADILYESTAKDWEKRTGTKIHEAYGLSETSGACHFTPIGKVKLNSFGVPQPNMVAAIMHPEKEEFLAPREIGEVVIKGPLIMKGYWNKPEETREVFVEIDGERWLRTGDLGSMDEDGYFYFYDRKKDMIKYKGHSVFAREVEEVLSSHPKIKEAGVIGISDPKVGENIKAFVVLEVDARGKLSEEEIVRYCEENMAHYKVPKIIEFVGEIPKTDVGKVSRRELREVEI